MELAGHYRVSLRLSLEDVGDLLGLELEDEDVDSIGGLLGKAPGQVPQPGVTATIDGLVLTGGACKWPGHCNGGLHGAPEPETDEEEDERVYREDAAAAS